MKKLLMLCALVALVGVAACAVPSPREQPATVRVRLNNELGLLLEHPVRYAVVWTLDDGFVVTADGALDAGLLEGSVIELPLRLPPESQRARLYPLEGLALVFGAIETIIFRPRLLLYADVDTNGSFSPAVLGGSGPDVVLAIEDGEIGAILDLDGFLAQLSLTQTEAFYDATDGRYTSFVHLQASSYFYSGFEVAAAEQRGPVRLSIEDPDEATLSLDCKRGRQRVDSIAGFEGFIFTPDVLVGSPLDPVAVCGLYLPNCEGIDLDSIRAPSLNDLGDSGRAQCRRGGVLEVLLLREVVTVCEGCHCDQDADDRAFAIDPASPPAWWPCGDTMEYCDSSLPLFVYAGFCAEP